jgi:hypothetical protein
MRRLLALGLVLLAACSNQVRHPLDDSETRPPDAATALTEAQTTLREVGDAVLSSVAHDDSEWMADGGCGTSIDSPEQGDISRILYMTYPTLPAERTADQVVASARDYWEGQGHTVGAGSPSMPTQAIARINGISYAVVDTAPGIELRAFLPCYDT